MNKLFIVFIFFAPIYVFSQEQFSFPLYFEDAVGNKDTLMIGYDATGSHGVDASFGEINKINDPWDNDFEVRITDEYRNRNMLSMPHTGLFHLKKEIIEDGCNSNNWGTQVAIDIKASQFPIHVYWDSTLFNASCLNGSVLTGVVPGGWWDTGGFRVFMNTNSSYEINNSQNDPLFYSYKQGIDTIYTTWFTFADSTLMTLNINSIEKSNIQVFPNPFVDEFKVINFPDISLQEKEIMDILGKKVDFEMENDVFKIRNSAPGIYFLNLLFTDGRKAQFKIVKN